MVHYIKPTLNYGVPCVQKLFNVNHIMSKNIIIQGNIKKQIQNRSQCHEAAQNSKFTIKIDCLGTYDAE